MGQPRYLKCACSSCDGHIEFPEDALGASIPCPHCGANTVLTKEPMPAAPGKKGGGVPKWLLLAVAALIVGGGIFAVIKSKSGGSEPESKPQPAPTKEKPNTPAPAPKADAAPKSTNGLEVVKYSIQKADKGSLRFVVGTVVNHGAAQYFRLKVEFGLYKQGKAVGTSSDKAPNLIANGKWEFKALILDDTIDEARLSSVTGEKE